MRRKMKGMLEKRSSMCGELENTFLVLERKSGRALAVAKVHREPHFEVGSMLAKMFEDGWR